MLQFLLLILLGAFAGTYGTLIGAGGGFVLVPALLFLYPDDAAETITSISLAAVFCNALSATLAYSRSRRIDYQTGIVFSLATIPGAILGALATTAVGRSWFDPIFGVLLLVVGIVLVIVPGRKAPAAMARVEPQPAVRLDAVTMALGVLCAGAFGFLSSFLGIGGGFLYVPALVLLLKFPVHIATGTSLFILTITAATGSLTHVTAGLFHHGIRRAVVLSIGAVVGAQIGAKLSQRVHGDWIMRSLAVALALVGARFIAVSLK